MFGAIDKDTALGFKQASDLGGNIEEMVLPYLDCVADFRKAVRSNAAAKKDVEALNLCDGLRDDVLPFLGVRMEDVEGNYITLLYYFNYNLLELLYEYDNSIYIFFFNNAL